MLKRSLCPFKLMLGDGSALDDDAEVDESDPSLSDESSLLFFMANNDSIVFCCETDEVPTRFSIGSSPPPHAVSFVIVLGLLLLGSCVSESESVSSLSLPDYSLEDESLEASLDAESEL